MKLWPIPGEQEAEHGHATDNPAGCAGRGRLGGDMQIILMGAGPYWDFPDRAGKES